jgi:hypothetical protein
MSDAISSNGARAYATLTPNPDTGRQLTRPLYVSDVRLAPVSGESRRAPAAPVSSTPPTLQVSPASPPARVASRSGSDASSRPTLPNA